MRIRPTTLLLLVSPLVLPVIVAYMQWATVGLPAVPPVPVPPPDTATAQGFPAWLRVTHYVNFLFIILLVRSGLQILMDHPRLYWNVHCTPGTEWLRLTPVEVPHGSGLDRQGGFPLPVARGSVFRAIGTPSAWPGTGTFSACCFGWSNGVCLCRPSVRHGPVEAARADFLARHTRCLGLLRPLRHFPPSPGTRHVHPLQPPPATCRTSPWCSSWHPSPS